MTTKTPEDLSAMEVKTARHGTPCCRAEEPGWTLAAMHDPSHRRGLWYREHPWNAYEARIASTSLPLYKVELCSGREGDDRYVSLEVGQIITAETLQDLRDVLESAAWMAREDGVADEDGRVVAWKKNASMNEEAADGQDEENGDEGDAYVQEVATRCPDLRSDGVRPAFPGTDAPNNICRACARRRRSSADGAGSSRRCVRASVAQARESYEERNPRTDRSKVEGVVMGSKSNPGGYDCYQNAHPDEPMFILLGRDPSACFLVAMWAQLREELGEDPVKVEEARKCARDLRDWAVAQGKEDRMKAIARFFQVDVTP